jgi:hypothetical protein
MTLLSDYQNGIKILFSIEDEAFQAILTALKSEPPSLNSEKLFESISQSIQNIDNVVLANIIEIFKSFYDFRSNRKLEDNEAIEQIIGSCIEDESLVELFNEVSIVLFRERLLAILESENSLSLGFKILNVARDQERLFLESRILTDIRTIFRSDSDISVPLGATITQMLKIEYFELNQRKEFFVALEPTDIEQLSEQINRAKQKANSLESMLKNASIEYLDISSIA